MSIRINTNPVAQRYAVRGEKIVEYSSPNGGGLISFREVDGRLVVDLYRHDDSVDVRVGVPDGMSADAIRITPEARGFLARAAADARGAGVDAVTQAALDDAARLGIGKSTITVTSVWGEVMSEGTEHVLGTTSTCRHCGRIIRLVGDTWVDPEAAGDDTVWRETCDSHDTFTAEHVPVPVEILGADEHPDDEG